MPPPHGPPKSPVPSVAPPGDFAAFEKELADLGERLSTQNYYEILGVERDAPAPAISAAFFKLAKRYHPDRLSPNHAELKGQVVKLFARMTEAHQTLTDVDKRKEYDQIVLSGGGTAEEQEEVQKVMRAVVAHQKASVLFKKQNLAEAERYAKEAMEGDPEQSEYLALYVRIVSQRPERAQSRQFDDLIKLMNDAVKRDPENERVRFARAELFKLAGKTDEALRDFRWCAERNPRNVDAIREVRLHAIRAGEKPPHSRPPHRPTQKPAAAAKDEKGGLLGKLFKR
jgi:curved DNA-binding protein CbpA